MTGVDEEEREKQENMCKYNALEIPRRKGKKKRAEPRRTSEGESCTSEGCEEARQGARGRCAANWFPISSKRRHTYGSGQNKDAEGRCSGTQQGASLAKTCARLEEEIMPKPCVTREEVFCEIPLQFIKEWSTLEEIRTVRS